MATPPNPPLPGRGITPEQSPQTSEPPFNNSAAGVLQEEPQEPHAQQRFNPPVPVPGGNSQPARAAEPVQQQKAASVRPIEGPDGTKIVPGAKEDERLKAIEARVQKMNDQLEMSGGLSQDRSQLQREFDNARYHRQ